MKTTRKRYSPEFKLQVALEALQEKEPISVLAKKHAIHPKWFEKAPVRCTCKQL